MKVYESEPFARLIIDRLKLSLWSVALLVFLFSWCAELLLSIIDGTAMIPGYSVRETLMTPPDSVVQIDKMNVKLVAQFSELYQTPHSEKDLVAIPLSKLESIAIGVLHLEAKVLPGYVLKERILARILSDFNRVNWSTLRRSTEAVGNMSEAEIKPWYLETEIGKIKSMKTGQELAVYIMRREVAQAQLQKFLRFSRQDLLVAYESYARSAINEMSRKEIIGNLISLWDKDFSWIYLKGGFDVLSKDRLLKKTQDSLSTELNNFVKETSVSKLRSRLLSSRLVAAKDMDLKELAYSMYDGVVIGVYYAHDWAGYLLRVFFFPLAMLLMVKYYQMIPEMFLGLFKRNIMQGKNSDSEAQEFLADLNTRYNRPKLVFFLFVLALGIIAYNAKSFYENERFEFLDLHQGLTPWYHFLVGNGVILIYAILNMIRIAATTSFGWHRLFLATRGSVKLLNGQRVELKVELNPLHPDRCGGLGDVGRVSYTFNLFLFLLWMTWAFYIMFVILIRNLSLFSGDLVHHMIGLTFFALVSPVVSFSPLVAAHRTMKDAKDRVLSEMSNAISEKEKTLRWSLTEGGSYSQRLRRHVDELHVLYTRASTMPVWPFELGTPSLVVGSIVIPIILPITVELLKSLVK